MKRVTILIVIVFTIGLTHSYAQNTWDQKADFGGTARYGAVGFSIGNKAYVGTGRDDTYPYFYGDFWEYDPTANTWTQKADFGGSARSHAVGFSLGSKGYIGTGTDIYPKNDLWMYDPVANTWSQKANFGGSARCYATGFSIGSKGYIGTGNDDNYYFKDFWEYDSYGDNWTKKADFGGSARIFATAFSIGSKGYIGTGSASVNFKDFWEYEPDTNTWTQKADFGGGIRWSAVGFSLGSKGYIGTGLSVFFPPKEHNDLWEYDPDANTWIQKADFGGSARSVATCFNIGSKGYIATGRSTFFPEKDLWEYTLDGVDTCNVPTSLSTVNITPTAAKLQWNAETDAIGFKVYYHPATVPQGIKKPSNTNSKVLKNLTPNTKYKWAVQSICETQPLNSSPYVMGPDFTTPPLRLGEDVNTSFQMEIFPNPASENATIFFSLNEQSPVVIQILDVNGRSLRVIADENFSEGTHEIKFNRESLSAGVYFLQLKTNEGVMMKKVVVE